MEARNMKTETRKQHSIRLSSRKALRPDERAHTKTIKQKEFIPAKPVEIYDALLNEQKHTAFTGAKATCDRRVGGKFTAWDGYITGKNMKLENGRRIIQEWKTSEWPDGYPPSVLEFTLKPKGEGTEIRMVQTKVPATQAKNYKQGWIDYYWTPLKKYFGKRSPVEK